MLTATPTLPAPRASAQSGSSQPPPATLQAYHQRISAHLMNLMRTPHHPHLPQTAPLAAAHSSSGSSGTRTTVTTSSASGQSGSACSGGSREASATSNLAKEDASQSSASASAYASSSSSPDMTNLLTARPGVSQGLGLGISGPSSPLVALDSSAVAEEDEDGEGDDEEPTPAGPPHILTLPDQPVPSIPATPLAQTREEEHRAAWNAEGKKVWRLMPRNFQLTLATPKSRRASNEPEDRSPEHHRRRSEEGTSGSTVSARPATSPSATAFDTLGFDVALHAGKENGSEELATRMGLLVPPPPFHGRQLRLIDGEPTPKAAVADAPISRVSSNLSQSSGHSANVSINLSTSRLSASPHLSSSAFTKTPLPEVRRSRDARGSGSYRLKPAPLRSVVDELAYEAKIALRMAKKQSDLTKKVRAWYRGVEAAGGDAIISPPEILPHIPSPSLASASMVQSPIAGTILLPLPKDTKPVPAHVPTKPLYLVPDTPAVERSASPFDPPAAPPAKLTNDSRSIDLELALRVAALQAILGESSIPQPASRPSSNVTGMENGEMTLRGSARMRRISGASGVRSIDELGAPLAARH